jgi:hypothetical protein
MYLYLYFEKYQHVDKVQDLFIFTFGLFNDVNSSNYIGRMIGCLVNDELERIRKEAVVA